MLVYHQSSNKLSIAVFVVFVGGTCTQEDIIKIQFFMRANIGLHIIQIFISINLANPGSFIDSAQ